MKSWMSLIWLLLICFYPLSAFGEVIAIYTPSLDFKDGSERNAYINKIAKMLTEETGIQWEGQAFARASDFEAAKYTLDAAIVDAEYFSSKTGALKPLAMLSANGQTTRPLKVIAKKGGSDKLYKYRDKKLVVVANMSLASSFVTASALGHEVTAQEYFSSIDEVRDARSAINAVEMGKADLALVFDGYDSGFTTVYTSSGVGLPIIAVNGAKLYGTQLEKVRHALQNINIHTSSFITGSAAYNASDAASYKRIASSRRASSLSYQPIEPETTKISVYATQLTEREDGIVFNPFQVQYVPTISDFDRKLEQRL